jgi:hypothetical protein
VSSLDELEKVNFHVLASIRRKPESIKFAMFWMPDQVRHDDSRNSYETIKLDIATKWRKKHKNKSSMPVIAILSNN